MKKRKLKRGKLTAKANITDFIKKTYFDEKNINKKVTANDYNI